MVTRIRGAENVAVIHCIGDSHASFFSGREQMQPVWPDRSSDRIPSFRSYRLGAVLAYSLHKEETTSRGREKLFEVVATLPKQSRILLCFGEIDCRVHLVKQAEKQGKPLESVVKECVAAYIRVAHEVQQMGCEVLVWGVIPSTTSGTIAQSEYIEYGTDEQRNEATRLFNTYLYALAEEKKILCISIFDQLVNSKGNTKFYYYADKIHLSQRAMPIAIKAVRAAFPDEHFVLYRSRLLSLLPRSVAFVLFCLVSLFRSLTDRLMPSIKTFLAQFISKNQFLFTRKQIIDWYRAGRPVPPPHIIKQLTIKRYAKKWNTPFLVETGTYLGDTVHAMKDQFEKIYSIELSRELFEKATARFSAFSHITILEGDSGIVLNELLPKITKPTLFWLDGHFSGGVTAHGELSTPIFKEVEGILKHHIDNHVILVDDARLFIGADDYPTHDAFRAFIQGLRPDMVYEVKNDIIRIHTSKKTV